MDFYSLSTKTNASSFGRSVLNKFVVEPLHWLLPPRCFSCHITIPANQLCCNTCYAKLPFQNDCCSRCGQAFSGMSDHCGRCITSPPPFDECYAAFRYESPISEQIHSLKYRDRPDYAARLAKLWAQEVRALGLSQPELLLPVPLHFSRLRSRGFNQAALLGHHLAKDLNLPFLNGAVTKTRKTAPQAELSLKQRNTNLKGCFEVVKPITAKHVAVVDDVYTTGSTAAEIARMLKKHGVETVQVWALAHTM